MTSVSVVVKDNYTLCLGILKYHSKTLRSLTAVLHLRILTKANNEYSVAHAYSHHYNSSPKLFTQQLRIHSSMDVNHYLPTPIHHRGLDLVSRGFGIFDLGFNVGIVTGIRRSKPKKLLIDGWR